MYTIVIFWWQYWPELYFFQTKFSFVFLKPSTLCLWSTLPLYKLSCLWSTLPLYKLSCLWSTLPLYPPQALHTMSLIHLTSVQTILSLIHLTSVQTIRLWSTLPLYKLSCLWSTLPLYPPQVLHAMSLIHLTSVQTILLKSSTLCLWYTLPLYKLSCLWSTLPLYKLSSSSPPHYVSDTPYLCTNYPPQVLHTMSLIHLTSVQTILSLIHLTSVQTILLKSSTLCLWYTLPLYKLSSSSPPHYVSDTPYLCTNYPVFDPPYLCTNYPPQVLHTMSLIHLTSVQTILSLIHLTSVQTILLKSSTLCLWYTLPLYKLSSCGDPATQRQWCAGPTVTMLSHTCQGTVPESDNADTVSTLYWHWTYHCLYDDSQILAVRTDQRDEASATFQQSHACPVQQVRPPHLCELGGVGWWQYHEQFTQSEAPGTSTPPL